MGWYIEWSIPWEMLYLSVRFLLPWVVVFSCGIWEDEGLRYFQLIVGIGLVIAAAP